MEWEVLEVFDITDLGDGRTRVDVVAWVTEGTSAGVMRLGITINTAVLSEFLARFAP